MYAPGPERTLYQSAAQRFKLPFWDPLLPRNRVESTGTFNDKILGVPAILAAKQVWVKRPGAQDLKPIDNPLYSYTFQWEALQEKGRKPVHFGNNMVS